MKKYKTVRINFKFEDLVDKTLLVKVEESLDVNKVLSELKDKLYESVDNDDYNFSCDLDFYLHYLDEDIRFEIIPETLDEVINFAY